MIFHPFTSHLIDFAQGTLDTERRRVVSQHLARCSGCRRIITEARRWIRESQEGAPKPSAGLRSRILHAAARGTHVLLPTADPGSPAFPKRRVAWSAAAAVLVIAGAVMVLPVEEAGADRSELVFLSSGLLPGNDISVRYGSTGMFAEFDSLILRARYRIPTDEPYDRDIEHVRAAVLHRLDRREFHGVLRAPADAVYVVFAVEDPSGELIDTNGQLFWELMLQDGGKPSYESLLQKQHDLMGRSWVRSYETARLAVDLYPERPRSWGQKLFFETAMFGGPPDDSAAAEYKARLRAFDRDWSTREAVPSDLIAVLFSFASLVEGPVSDLVQKWKVRLYDQAPRHPVVIEQEIGTIIRHRDAPTWVAEFDDLWQAVGPNEALAGAGYRASLRAQDPVAVLRWADRWGTIAPSERLIIAEQLATIPVLRDSALGRVRRELRRLENSPGANRPLHLSSTRFGDEIGKRRRGALAALGRVLLSRGETESGLTAIDLALTDDWHPELLQRAAQARLSIQDTLGAFGDLAAVAVDPNTLVETKDSLGEVAVRIIGDGAWRQNLQRAAERMQAYVWQGASNVRVPPDLALVDENGVRTTWQSVVQYPVTIVTTWLPYSAQWLHQVALLNRRFRDDERVGLFAIAADTLSPELARLVGDKGSDLPVYYDVTGRLREALNWWIEPAFYVLDSAGHLRFLNSSFEDVLRQVSVLLAGSVSDLVSPADR